MSHNEKDFFRNLKHLSEQREMISENDEKG
jgi:hypothetical protein